MTTSGSRRLLRLRRKEDKYIALCVFLILAGTAGLTVLLYLMLTALEGA